MKQNGNNWRTFFQPTGQFRDKGSSRGMFSLSRKPGPNQRGWGPEPYLMFKSNRRRVRHPAISVPKETPGIERTAALKYLQDFVTHSLCTTGTNLRALDYCETTFWTR